MYSQALAMQGLVSFTEKATSALELAILKNPQIGGSMRSPVASGMQAAP